MCMEHVHVDLKQRVFSKAPALGMRQQLAVLAEAGNASARTQLETQEDVLEAALAAGPTAQIVVDAAGALAVANQAAQALFALTPGDCGRPLQDLEISYRPVELRSLIVTARSLDHRSDRFERYVPIAMMDFDRVPVLR